MPDALRFLILTAAGWVNRHQEDVIDSLREENRVLREQRGPRRYARARLSATEMRLWPPFQKHLLSDGPPSGEICPEIQDINLGIHNEFRTLDRDSINAGGCLSNPPKSAGTSFAPLPRAPV